MSRMKDILIDREEQWEDLNGIPFDHHNPIHVESLPMDVNVPVRALTIEEVDADVAWQWGEKEHEEMVSGESDPGFAKFLQGLLAGNDLEVVPF